MQKASLVGPTPLAVHDCYNICESRSLGDSQCRQMGSANSMQGSRYAITAIRDILTGVWDIFYSIYKGDWWGILHALLKIVATALHWLLTMVRIITFLDTVDYIVEEINHNRLKEYVRIQLQNKYGGQELQNIKDTLHLDHGAFGYRIPMRAIRTYLDSETPSPSTEPDEVGLPNLVVLNKHGIDLEEYCGFKFTEGFTYSKRYKTLKKGLHAGGGGGGEVDNPISKDELHEYISSGGTEGPKFFVFCMRDGVLKTKLRTAELKVRELGLMPRWTTEDKEVTLAKDIKHNGYDTAHAETDLANFLINPIGRTDKSMDMQGALNELCTPVAVGIFRYTDKLRGLTVCLFRKSIYQHRLYF